ncbi:MAG TPA: hypothetical protein VLV83_13305 [Acidobacteriota bacterium]|nr:hypothetical protein [Acidobacteriota bacterium]
MIQRSTYLAVTFMLVCAAAGRLEAQGVENAASPGSGQAPQITKKADVKAEGAENDGAETVRGPTSAGDGNQDGDPEDADHDHATHDSHSRLSDQPIPLAQLPDRPKPLLELGTPFLGTGRIGRGFRLPGGAVWQPSFLLFGSFRSGLSHFDDDRVGTTQWANRLDLFGNLYLSGTERLVFGLRPLDETVDDGTRQFTGGQWFSPDPNDRGGGVEGFNFDWDTVTHLFFEGEIGEIFPNLDPEERGSFDIGFSVGRQPINFQEGLLVNDFLDAVGITRNNLKPGGTVNLRVTGLYAWNQINRNTPSGDALIRNREADGARLFGLFTEVDWRVSTVAVDLIYLNGGTFRGTPQVPDVEAGDAIYTGVSFVQRFGNLNSSFRVLGSIPLGDRTPDNNPLDISDPAGGGALFFSEISWTPHHSHDFIYVNGFAAFDRYRAAALDPTIPGPLARAGFLFAGPGLGNFPGALSPTAEDVVGGAVGYQKFLDRTRQQLLVEAGGRLSTSGCGGSQDDCGSHSLAGGARYQIAIGRRSVLVLDGYVSWENLRGASQADFGQDSRLRLGSRIEWLLKF